MPQRAVGSRARACISRGAALLAGPLHATPALELPLQTRDLARQYCVKSTGVCFCFAL